MLRLFKPNDEELDAVVEPYRMLLAEGRGHGGLKANSSKSIEIGRKKIKPSETPFGRWLEDYAFENKISLTRLGEILGTSNFIGGRSSFGLEIMSEMLQRAPGALGLSSEQTESLAEAVAETVEEKISEGHEFRGYPAGARIKRYQEEFGCITFNASQAAKILGISQQRVSQIRQKWGLPLLMTGEDVERIAIRLDGTRERREKTQMWYKEQRLRKAE